MAMQEQKSDIRGQISSLLQQCLDLGPRGDLRATLMLAAEQAAGTAPKELTDLHYRRLPTGGRLPDPTRPGFIMIASKRGKRWMYRTQGGGIQRQITLGRYPAMSLEEARKKWLMVSSEGPATTDIRAKTTLAELVRGYLDHIADRRTAPRVGQVLQKHLLTNHADMPLSDVTAEILEGCYEHLIAKQPGAARNILTPINAMMRWAESDKKLPSGMTAPRLRKVPKAKIKEFHPSNRDLKIAIKAFGEMGAVGEILNFQLLTGVRISEAREAEWSEIDLSERKWRIPGARMKNGHDHMVMLSDAAMAVLERQTTRDGSVFGQPSHNVVMKDWRRKRVELGLSAEYGSHCHRKALLTWVAENGGGRDVRDRLSAHHDSSSVDSHYQRSELNKPAAEWWQRWADHIVALGSDNVVELKA
jgi:integrase